MSQPEFTWKPGDPPKLPDMPESAYPEDAEPLADDFPEMPAASMERNREAAARLARGATE